ncbi:MAG TPA: DUF3108 domain-containing protein [Caulobacteraceae bacterium]|jgi:hypothetical protein|nr:DUF3108 domain-containing protein [Caulobacteraceae bacterium]
MTRRTVFAVVTGLAAMTVSSAQAAPPPANLSLSAGYEGSLLIKLVDLRLRTRAAAGRYSTDVHVESSGAVSFIRRFDINAASVGAFDHGRANPAAYVQHSLEGKKRSSRTQVFRGPIGAVDPLTQGLRLTSTPMASAPCPGVTPTFDGKQRYDLILNYVGRGALAPGQQGFGLSQPVQCRLDFRPISGFKTNSQQGLRKFVQGDIRATFAKAAGAGVWVPTEIAASTMVGALRLELTSFSVQGTRAAFEPPAPASQPQAPPRKARSRGQRPR